jgi:hypothetical protein
MPVLDIVVGIVVVVEEVPARDVVGKPVVVVVKAVGEGQDQVLGGEESRRPMAQLVARVAAADNGRDARIARVVEHVEHAVVVDVVVAMSVVTAAGGVPVRGAVDPADQRRGQVVARRRQLALVEMDLVAQIGHRAEVVPSDPRVEDIDQHVGTAGRDLPGGVQGAVGARPRRLHGLAIDQAHPPDPAQLVGLEVDLGGQRVGGRSVRRGGELPVAGLAEVIGRYAGRQPECVRVVRVAAWGVGKVGAGGGDDPGCAEQRGSAQHHRLSHCALGNTSTHTRRPFELK